DFLIEFDNYYKTHSPENKELAIFFFNELTKNGHIYRKKIPTIYCEHCKRYLPDRLVKGTCPHCKTADQYGDICEKCSGILKGLDLLNPYCVLCSTKPIHKESEHYFFKLRSFAGKLEQWMKNSSVLQPDIRHWIEEWLKKGLEDWCISRDAPYFGFEIPNSKKETGEKKYFYVWLDAPIGYISSTKNYGDKHHRNWKNYWYKGKVHHIIGKDIVYFHFLFWPAMLMAIGIPVPDLTVHGFITVDGQKMSKSRGTFFTAQEFLKLFPAEALRFYYASHLDRKVIDIDLQLADLQAVTNNVMIGNIANFCYRVLTFAQKNYGKIKVVADEKKLQQEIETLTAEINKNYQVMDFKSAVKNILKITDIGNAYFQKAAPWNDPLKAEAAVGWCVTVARNVAIIVSPILPEVSRKVHAALKEKDLYWNDINFHWKGTVKEVQKLAVKIEELPAAKTFPLELRVGKIIEVTDHPNADSLYLLQVDFGKEKRQIVAGLKKYFIPAELLHQSAVFCVNLKPAKLRGEKSEAMILVADDGKNIALLQHPKANLGDEALFTGLAHSSAEITFDEFLKINMLVVKGKIVFDDKVLAIHHHEIAVQGVKEGAKVR
ncbi:MAG: methionine--tRNA ligase, partial [Nanoarchaeota archaeon]|nr:methionine--tRNA ligase [Nanoarchaeota archaeon]